ncbi:hypothetical protein ACTXT7_005844 [Hymenolepis weldensis]
MDSIKKGKLNQFQKYVRDLGKEKGKESNALLGPDSEIIKLTITHRARNSAILYVFCSILMVCSPPHLTQQFVNTSHTPANIVRVHKLL